ncbi:hypothetical protein GTGU_00217 [Trabulsiella guamensis ATCC 49490]|uniref:Uncharacterized protein n=1 Tax=Trabulsiella guamensis ATCC 49490 TaxID=1005994 RepID=A0A085ARI7_9ENTR|nr:hypothetical protein GTGU_00217 [Trabulsiella guamensis ATCC 49490]
MCNYIMLYRISLALPVFQSSIIIMYRESKSSHCNSKKTGNIALNALSMVRHMSILAQTNTKAW